MKGLFKKNSPSVVEGPAPKPKEAISPVTPAPTPPKPAAKTGLVRLSTTETRNFVARRVAEDIARCAVECAVAAACERAVAKRHSEVRRIASELVETAVDKACTQTAMADELVRQERTENNPILNRSKQHTSSYCSY